MAKTEIGQIQEIRYFRTLKAPTLKQFLHRRVVAQVMSSMKGEVGTGIDPGTGRVTPISAIKAKEILKGINADKIIADHPDWVEDYRREYPNA